MIEKIDHIAMVVRDLDMAVRVYSKGLGLDAERIEQSDEFQVRMAFIPVGDVHIELIEPIGPGRAQDFLKEHGEGMYHICYRVGDIEKAIEKFGSTLEFRDRKPRKGSGLPGRYEPFCCEEITDMFTSYQILFNKASQKSFL